MFTLYLLNYFRLEQLKVNWWTHIFKKQESSRKDAIKWRILLQYESGFNFWENSYHHFKLFVNKWLLTCMKRNYLVSFTDCWRTVYYCSQDVWWKWKHDQDGQHLLVGAVLLPRVHRFQHPGTDSSSSLQFQEESHCHAGWWRVQC